MYLYVNHSQLDPIAEEIVLGCFLYVAIKNTVHDRQKHFIKAYFAAKITRNRVFHVLLRRRGDFGRVHAQG